MSAATCDYAANGGYLEGSASPLISDVMKRGAMPLIHTRWTSSRMKQSEIRDGTSSTLLLWESAGKEWYTRPNRRLENASWFDWHEHTKQKYGSVVVTIDENQNRGISCNNYGSVGYFTCWAGINRFRLRVWDQAGLDWGSFQNDPQTYYRTVNVTNSFRAPFSFHPQICIVAYADGSIRSIDESIDTKTIVGLTSRFGGEVVQPD